MVVFFYLHKVAKSTYRPTHSQKSPEKQDFVVHTQTRIKRTREKILSSFYFIQEIISDLKIKR